MLPDPIQLVVRVAETLDELGIPYLVGGSLASSQFGVPRSTQDVDLVVDLRLSQVGRLLRALQEEFYLDAGQIRDAVRHQSSFNLVHFELGYKVDFFIAAADDLGREQLKRRQLEELVPGKYLYFASPEDVVLRKLEWYRLGGEISDRQWNDILGVLSVQQSKLDFDYMRGWAGRLTLTELLDRAVADAGLE